jgi:hypothetical protein
MLPTAAVTVADNGKDMQNFSKVIDRAMLACDTAGFEVAEHFPAAWKTVEMPTKPCKLSGEIGFPDLRKTPYADTNISSTIPPHQKNIIPAISTKSCRFFMNVLSCR